jgi:polysaccharide export outer membrane protein
MLMAVSTGSIRAKPMAVKPTIATIVALCAILLHMGNPGTATPAAAADGPVSPGPYRVAPGDRLNVIVFGQSELTGEFIVHRTGGIGMPLLGEIQVSRMTVKEIEQSLAKQLQDGYIQRPAVSVRVSEFRPIYVLGDVRTPGSYPFRDGQIVVNAIALAGGTGQMIDFQRATMRTEFLNAEQRLRVLEDTRRTLLVRRARLEAQRDGRTDFQVPELISEKGDQRAAQLVANERQTFHIQASGLEEEVRLLRAQVPGLEAAIKHVQAESEHEATQLKLVQGFLGEYTKLFAKGIVNRQPYIELQREEARLKSNIERLAAEVIRLEQSIGDIGIRVNVARSTYQRQVLAELQETRARLQETETTLPTAHEIREAYLQQAGSLFPSDLDKRQYSYLIVRVVDDKSESFAATATTPLAPGDVVEVKRVNGDAFTSLLQWTPGVERPFVSTFATSPKEPGR